MRDYSDVMIIERYVIMFIKISQQMTHDATDEELKKLRQKYRSARADLVLWKSPIKTLYHFILELLHLLGNVLKWYVGSQELFFIK